jgi:enoyl-CoA hydratase
VLSLPDTIAYRTEGRIATVTIDRPEAHNALTGEMLGGLERAFAAFDADDDLWVAIVTGAGTKAFCAGADLSEVIPRATSEGLATAIGHPTKRFFSEVYKPIIGAVNGLCVAGGLELLQGTDLRVAAEHAVFGLGEVRWGIVPAGGSHIRLPRQIPWAVAMELLLTGQPISAARAYDVGLVNRVVPAADLIDEARALAEVICRNGPVAVRTAKEIAVRSLNLEQGFALESALVPRVLGTEDAKEGPRAFMEKRPPRFVGR